MTDETPPTPSNSSTLESLSDETPASLTGSVFSPDTPNDEKKSFIVEQHTVTYLNPFPPASEMEKYAAIGIADKIIDMISEEAHYRRQRDEKLMNHSIAMNQQNTSYRDEVSLRDFQLKQRGQLFAFILAIFGISFSVYAAKESPWVAALIASFSLVIIVGSFINNAFAPNVMRWSPLKHSKDKEDTTPPSATPSP